ncbi:MAG: hypothetical protein U5K70_01435 [Halodesulfurarchaeum sp.]|nr:hypothetical protein [Halodesulfurarchaeum sp.]
MVFYFTYSNLLMVYVVGVILFLITPGQPILHFAAVPALFGRKNVGMVMSYINAFSVGAGLAIGPVLFGYMADFFGGYGEALLLAAAMFVASFLAAVYGLRLSRQE